MGTDREQWGSSGLDYVDRRAVKLALAVDEALGEPPGDYADAGIETFPAAYR